MFKNTQIIRKFSPLRKLHILNTARNSRRIFGQGSGWKLPPALALWLHPEGEHFPAPGSDVCCGVWQAPCPSASPSPQKQGGYVCRKNRVTDE